MKPSLKVGFGFGVTSGIITTLGLIVGLQAGTHSRSVVIGGILTIAIADTFSDALGVHVSEESVEKRPEKDVWLSTFSTFITKFIFAMTFIAPVLLFELPTAVIISVIWGLSILAISGLYIAKIQEAKPWKVIVKHLLVAVIVIVATQFTGNWIERTFGGCI